jgi:hypothetical protein
MVFSSKEPSKPYKWSKVVEVVGMIIDNLGIKSDKIKVW